MGINADKPHLWKTDIAKSVDSFNRWFMRFAPDAYRKTRVRTSDQVKAAIKATDDLRNLDCATLTSHPEALPILRMATAPPIARDRLIGLAQTTRALVHRLEAGKLPVRMQQTDLTTHLERICDIIARLLDRDIFPWLASNASPSEHERTRASTIVADRLCGAVSDPIIRNAQEQRQLEVLGKYLISLGYKRQMGTGGKLLTDMEPGTFAFRMNVVVGDQRKVNIPIDVVIQPRVTRPGRLPLFIEAKSAGDFANTNKRRKEEATKIHQLRATYGNGRSLFCA